MRAEAVEALSLTPSSVVVDATLGGAGHFKELLARLGADGILVGIDADAEAVARGREAVARTRRPDRPVVHLITDNFRNLARVLDRLDLPKIDAALFDLGWSGHQLESGRGFSFRADEPLLMTYASAELGAGGETAANIVNTFDERKLGDLLFQYGEERFSRRIARAIVSARRVRRIVSTSELADIVAQAVPAWYRNRKTHPATKTFQALRIAVNDEYAALAEGLRVALARLAQGGRVVVITFHSGEDRIVKELFRTAVEAGEGALVFKKPRTPTAAEVRANPRARSAKLRAFQASAQALASDARALHYAYA